MPGLDCRVLVIEVEHICIGLPSFQCCPAPSMPYSVLLVPNKAGTDVCSKSAASRALCSSSKYRT